jgi:hypothetical protein
MSAHFDEAQTQLKKRSETQFCEFEHRGLLSAGRADRRYGCDDLNLGLRLIKKKPCCARKNPVRDGGAGEYEGGKTAAVSVAAAETRGGSISPMRKSAQERWGSSGTSLSLAAIRPNSGSVRAFIFRIALLR